MSSILIIHFIVGFLIGAGITITTGYYINQWQWWVLDILLIIIAVWLLSRLGY